MNPSPEIQCLCRDLEQRMGQQLQSPADFQLLLNQIWEKKHAVLSRKSCHPYLWQMLNIQKNQQEPMRFLSTLRKNTTFAKQRKRTAIIT